MVRNSVRGTVTAVLAAVTVAVTGCTSSAQDDGGNGGKTAPKPRASARGFGAAFRPLPPSSWADDVQPVTAIDTATSTAVTVPRTELRTTKIPCPRP